MNIYKTCTAETYSFLVHDTTLPSDNPLHFSKNLLEWIYDKIMTIDDEISDDKLLHVNNTEATKISALSSGKISKYDYLTGEEIFPSNQNPITEQAKFKYSPLGKASQKQAKNNWSSKKKKENPKLLRSIKIIS